MACRKWEAWKMTWLAASMNGFACQVLSSWYVHFPWPVLKVCAKRHHAGPQATNEIGAARGMPTKRMFQKKSRTASTTPTKLRTEELLFAVSCIFKIHSQRYTFCMALWNAFVLPNCRAAMVKKALYLYCQWPQKLRYPFMHLHLLTTCKWHLWKDSNLEMSGQTSSK